MKTNKKISRIHWATMLACVFAMDTVRTFSALAFDTKCGEPDTCIILVRSTSDNIYCHKPGFGGLAGYLLEDVSGYDYNCEQPQKTRVKAVSCFYPAGRYDVTYYKWYWNGTTWMRGMVVGHYTIGDSGHTPLPPVPGEITGTDYVDIRKLYPNGCADTPPPQPTAIASPDTGKPECSDLRISID